MNVTTESGVVAGRRGAGVTAFLGVPYAAPPTGERRFARPEAALGWTGVRDATEFGASAPQPGSARARLLLGRSSPSAESCLFLNVWTPWPDAGSGLPVLVWLHGGGFVNGSGDVAAHRGATFARQARTVVVTVNYRLGALGFAHHPVLARGAANLGLYDQQAALAWVRRNVTGFGGDPERITLAGDSAGAMAAGLHALLPGSRSLFAQLAMHSGTPTLIRAESAAATVERLAAELGVEVAALGDVHTTDLVRAGSAIAPAHRFGPVAAGELAAAPERPHAAASPRPMLIGTTADEGTFFLVDERAPRRVTADEAAMMLAAKLGGDGRERYRSARARVRPPRRDEPHWVLAHALTEAMFERPADAWSAAATASGFTVWRSRYVRPATLWGGRLGATHTIDVPVLLGTYDDPQLRRLYAADRGIDAVSMSLRRAWAAFLHTGAPPWPGWTASHPYVHELGAPE